MSSAGHHETNQHQTSDEALNVHASGHESTLISNHEACKGAWDESRLGSPSSTPQKWPWVWWCRATQKGERLITGWRALSPADSPCTGQNAETRSNGAALGRPMMLFLTPILNMPGAAGFSAQGSLLLYERRNINTARRPGRAAGWICFPNTHLQHSEKNNPRQIRDALSLSLSLSLFL